MEVALAERHKRGMSKFVVTASVQVNLILNAFMTEADII